MKDLEAQLREREANHLYRRRRISESPQQVEMIIDGREVISFCSNDYLGLANDPRIKQAFTEGVEQYGVGSGSAHLINGHSTVHHQLEETLADITGYPSALLFSTGYMANLGIAQTLLGRGDCVLQDRLNHASLIDGGLSSGARLVRYQHKDTDDLDHKLATRTSGEKLVMTDGVFSMDGDIADVGELVNTCKKHDAMLMLDDAHGFGVLGNNGTGTLEHTSTSPRDVDVYMATLGKAVGTAGAFVAGSEDMIETLIQQARTYIYTTAQPPAVAAATLKSLHIIAEEPERRERLRDNIEYFRHCAIQNGIELTDSDTAIQPVIIGDEQQALSLSESLFEKSLLVTAIRPPTVPKGTARLRITLCAMHTRHQIDQLVESIT